MRRDKIRVKKTREKRRTGKEDVGKEFTKKRVDNRRVRALTKRPERYKGRRVGQDNTMVRYIYSIQVINKASDL